MKEKGDRTNRDGLKPPLGALVNLLESVYTEDIG